MASLYYDFDPTYSSAIDGIDVDRISIGPSSPTLSTRAQKGMSLGSDDSGLVGSGLGLGGGRGADGGNGLGSLADELAGLGDYDSDEEDEGYEEEEEEMVVRKEEDEEETKEYAAGGIEEEIEEEEDDLSDSLTTGEIGEGRPRTATNTSISASLASPASNGHIRTKSKASLLSPKSPKSPRTTSRRRPTHTSVSNLSGNLQNALNSDEEDEDERFQKELEEQGGVSKGLQQRIDQIERLAAQGRRMKFGRSGWSEDRGGGGGVDKGSGSYARLGSSHGAQQSLPRIHGGEDSDDLVGVDEDVIPRFMDGLQKLQQQTMMETATQRLSTANAAISTHLDNQITAFRKLTHSLHPSTFALSTSFLDPDDHDSITDLVLALFTLLPQPTHLPLEELASLRHITTSLISQLNFLSDSLHMARQNTTAATRKLRVVKEACAEWKGQLEAAEKGRRWIEEGDWVGRCSRREARKVCEEVLQGFERSCKGMEREMEAWAVVA